MRAFTRTKLWLCVVLVACTTAIADDKDPKQEEKKADESKEVEFVPENDRERALLAMIKSLRAEVASLKQEIEKSKKPRMDRRPLGRDLQVREGADIERERAMLREREAFERERIAREGDEPRLDRRGVSPRMTKEIELGRRDFGGPLAQKTEKTFKAYDKNKDKSVDLIEWLAMKEGEMTDDRKKREQAAFEQIAGKDGKITFREFLRWTESRMLGRALLEGGRGKDELPVRDGIGEAKKGDAKKDAPKDGDK